MRITMRTAASVAAVTAVAAVGLGAAGAANAASAPATCTGTGPASTLSQEQHDKFLEEMTALKEQHDAIMAKYGLSAPGGRAGQGAGAGQRMRGMGRAGGASLTAEKRLAMQKELAAWRVTRDALFAKYGLTAPNQGRGA
jgi:hypothetical protein